MTKRIYVVSNTTGEILEEYGTLSYNSFCFMMEKIKAHHLINRIEKSKYDNSVTVYIFD